MFCLVLAGKLAAEVVAERAAGVPYSVGEKEIRSEIYDKAANSTPKEPVGVIGDGAIAFGGGAVLTGTAIDLLQDSDPEVLIKTH